MNAVREISVQMGTTVKFSTPDHIFYARVTFIGEEALPSTSQSPREKIPAVGFLFPEPSNFYFTVTPLTFDLDKLTATIPNALLEDNAPELLTPITLDMVPSAPADLVWRQ